MVFWAPHKAACRAPVANRHAKLAVNASQQCITCVLVALSISTPSIADAQSDTNEGSDAEQLQTLTISGSNDQTPSLNNVQHEDFAGQYTRVEGEALARTDIDLSEALAFEAGIQQKQLGGYGSFSHITVRASTPSQTAVFLDGIRLNGASNAVVDLSVFDARSLKSVDIYRASAPVQLGASNIGGAINLSTRSTRTPGTKVKLSVGSFNTVQANLSHTRSYQQWRALGTVDIGHSQNDFSFTNTNGTPLNLQDDRQEQRNNAEITKLGVLGKVTYQFSELKRADVLLQHTQRSTGVPEWRNAPNNEAHYDDGRGQLHASFEHQSLGAWSYRHSSFIQWANDHYLDKQSQVGLGEQDFRSGQRVLGLSSYWDRFTQSGKWALTAELRRDQFNSENLIGRRSDVSAVRDSATVGAAYTRFFLEDALLITPQLRLELHRSRFDDPLSGVDESAQTNSVINPEIGLRWELSNTFSLTSSLGQYFRLPTFYEMFGTQGLVIGNDDLTPEVGVNADIGIAWEATPEISTALSVFYSLRDDAIVTVYDARGTGRNTNTGQATVIGLEWNASWQPTNRLKVRANVTVQDAVNQSDIAAFYNKQLPNQSAVAAYTRANFTLSDRWQIWGEVTSSQSRYYDLGNFLPATDATLVNSGLRWQHQRWQSAFTINNITDENVEDFNGFPKPGRSLNLSLTYRL